ncbi:uncharacterized protein DC041_0007976, partial [Schistosoma bovis]
TVHPSSVNQDHCKRPRMLWAGYFCVPDLSSIPNNFSTLGKSETIMNSNIFITAGPDATPDLDSVIPNAEEIFRKIISILGLPNNSKNLASTTTGTNNDDSTSQTSRSSMYTTIDAVWDGQFPPKAPRPEDIIVVDESVNPPPVVTIEVPQEDQNCR